jgi:hypothetical protein
VLEERREGDCTTSFAGARASLDSSAEGTRLKTQLRERANATFARLFGPHVVLAAPKKAGPVFETGRRQAARSLRTAGESLRREENSNEATSIEREDQPLPGVPVCRCKRSTFAEVVGPCAAQVVVALSRGERRRSLAFDSIVFSGSHRKGAGRKKTNRVEGEIARSRGAQAHRKMERRDHGSWFRVMVLASTREHGTESKGSASRRGTLRWKASSFG